MNRLIRHRIAFVAMAFAAVMAVAPTILPAQESEAGELNATEPVVVVSLGSIDKLMLDAQYLSSAMGQAQAGGMFTMMARGFTDGLDTTQPIVVMVPLVDQAPQPIAMIPTPDVKGVLERREAQIGPAIEEDDGTMIIALGASTVYIRQLGNWAVLAPEQRLLDLAPADPSDLIEGMGNEYDLSVRVRLQQVPAETRNMYAALIRQTYERTMEQQNSADAEAGREMAENTLDQLDMVLEQTDEIQFGFNIDQTAKQIVFDGSFKAIPGSELAAMYGGQQAIPSRFASVIREDAAAYYHAASSITPEAIKQTRNSLNLYLNGIKTSLANEGLAEGQQADIDAMIDRIGELAVASVEEGKADVGALLLADPNDFRFVFGAFVSDGNEVASIVKELAGKLKDQPKAPRFDFDVSTYNGVTMHRVEADVPADRDEARLAFGDTLRVHLGTGDKVVYAAVGNQSETLMKELIDASNEDGSGNRPVGQLRVSLLPILQYAQSIKANDAVSSMIDALSRASDSGEIFVIASATQNGSQSRVTIGEGLLQAIGAAVRQAQEARMQGQF